MDHGIQKRAVIVCAALVVFLSLLSVRLVYVQVVMHDHYAEQAEQYYLDKEILPASRGMIFDANGDLLARDQTVYDLVADKYHLADHGIASAGVARAEGLSIREVRRRYSRDEIRDRYATRVVTVLSSYMGFENWALRRRLDEKERGPVILAREIEEDVSRELRQLMQEERIGGVYLQRGMRRYYPSPLSLTHVIGYVDAEGNGQEGVEKVMDERMKGRDGYRYIERDRKEREILAFRHETLEPKDGANVRLTIDMGLQNIVEQVVDEAWLQYTPEKISVIFMRPQTGEVLAMACRPHFDLRTRDGSRRNVAISDFYEPGSTFKIVGFSAALERGLISPGTPVNCHWGAFRDGRLNLKDHHPYGELTVTQIMAKSSNIGTYKIVRQIGQDGFYEAMQKFGFGQRTGIDLTAESSGIIYPPSKWSVPSMSRMAMGYEVGVTPLQMLSALGVIANGGKLMEPQVLASVEDADGRVLERFEPTVVREVVSARTANMVRRMLMGVVNEEGTGSQAAVEGYTVAGKTGTAQKVNVAGGGYLHGRYVVSFMGFLPAEDPQLMGIVVVDDPHADGIKLYGGTIAAPIWADIAGQAAKYLNLTPDVTQLSLAE